MDTTNTRRGGVLMHITSLPGPEHVGTLGKSAYRFVDFLHSAGMRVWQVLPVGPTGYGESPYQSACALAGNPNMIDLEMLHEEGYLPSYAPETVTPSRQVDFPALFAEKEKWLRAAFAHNRERLEKEGAYDVWCAKWPWLHDYALFMAIKGKFNRCSWMEWPDQDIRLRKSEAMEKYENELKEDVQYFMFLQFLFREQWMRLRAYANDHGVSMLGDMPIYVAEDSSDVWANAEYFQLDRSRRPIKVAGVPPDYFSEDGQLWGNPLYRWGKLRDNDYGFWMERLRAMGQLFDSVRIDHFIGFANYYSVKAGAPNAREGKWIIGPGKAFFKRVREVVPEVNVVAEDLGAVNERVVSLLKFCGYPGMKVMQFGFDGGEENPHNLNNFVENCVAYTGTHDNDTTLGWWHAADENLKAAARKVLGDVDDDTVVDAMIKTVFMSPANTAVAPIQDFLGLDSCDRMNTPGTLGGSNWCFRVLEADLTEALSARMRALNEAAGRA